MGLSSHATSPNSFSSGTAKVEVRPPGLPVGGGKGRARCRKAEGVSGKKEAGLENVAKGGVKPKGGFVYLE